MRRSGLIIIINFHLGLTVIRLIVLWRPAVCLIKSNARVNQFNNFEPGNKHS